MGKTTLNYAAAKGNVEIIQNKTYELLKNCTAAIVTSGTATLETALFKVPQIVCYKSSWTTYLIGKILLKNLNYISLVNLIANKLIVKELIQNACSKKNLIKELNIILEKEERAKIISNYNKLEIVWEEEAQVIKLQKLYITT